MLWSEVVLITVTLCSEVSQLWICANFNVFRTVLPELLPTPPSIHTSLQLEKHYIGRRLSTVLSLRLPCLFISSYTVVTPNTLNPFSYPDIVHITLVEVNLMACFLRFPTLLQFSSLESILDPVLRMTHLWFGMTFLTRSVLQTHLPPSGKSWSHTSLEKHIHPKFPISSCFLRGADPCNVSGLWILNNVFVWCALESVFLTEITRYKSAIRIRISMVFLAVDRNWLYLIGNLLLCYTVSVGSL